METLTAGQLSVALACPRCHELLSEAAGGLHCGRCSRTYPIRQGVPSFVDDHPFYEGRWAQPDLSAGFLRNLLVKKERFFWSWLRGRRGTVLDLGCGAGWRLFCTVGPVTGVDLSLASLREASHIYQRVAQAHLGALPFPDRSFDFVVSSDVLGHIPVEHKDEVLGEIYRVLRPGGLTLHYVEAEGNDPLMRLARRYPDLYQRHVVAPEGHVGLEPADSVIRRFRRAGFRPRQELAVYRGPMYVRRVRQLFDNEYRQKSRLVSALALVSRGLSRFSPLELAANLAMSGVIEVADLLCPSDWAGGVLVCYEK